MGNPTLGNPAPLRIGSFIDIEGIEQPEPLLSLLSPYSADEMEAYPVSTLVNSPKNESRECIKPLAWK